MTSTTGTVLVIGATGFLGSQIRSELSTRNISYIATSRTPQADDKFIVCNVLDTESIRQAMQGVDIVIHSAGLVSHDPKRAEDVWKIHVTGTENVLSVAKELGIKRVVYLSTSGTIGVSDSAENIAKEDSPSPFSFITNWGYYRSKYFAEQIALKYAQQGLPLVCLNPSLLLGPGDRGESTKSIKLFLDDKIPLAPCGGVAFVDVRDVAKTVVDAISVGKTGERYLLNSSNMKFVEFYQRVARLANKPAPFMQMPDITRKALSWFKIDKVAQVEKSDMEIASHFWYVDASKAQKDLGFQGRDPMDTLFDTVEYLQQDDFDWFKK